MAFISLGTIMGPVNPGLRWIYGSICATPEAGYTPQSECALLFNDLKFVYDLLPAPRNVRLVPGMEGHGIRHTSNEERIRTALTISRHYDTTSINFHVGHMVTYRHTGNQGHLVIGIFHDAAFRGNCIVTVNVETNEVLAWAEQDLRTLHTVRVENTLEDLRLYLIQAVAPVRADLFG